MAFTRMLRNLIRDPDLGPRIVPIIPDEARTFGMDPLFNEVGIYSATGQRYDPVDSELVLKYREAIDGQVLEEGITEAGSAAGFQAAGTSYATHGFPVIPFYIFYSMFGFQRTGDQLWAAGDARARGFLMAATAGRTTLTGEGLQHDDGHSHVLAMTNPAVRQYDPTFAYELAAIIRDGIERMHVKGEDLIYYISIYNENYAQAPKPEGVDEGSCAGIYRFADGARRSKSSNGSKAAPQVRLVGSGSILQQVLAAQALLAEQFGDRGRGLLGAVVPAAPPRRARASTAGTASTRRRSRRVPYVVDGARREGRPDRRRDRLDEGAAGPRPTVDRRAVRHARHRRLRPERHARGAAGLLRDRPAEHRRRGALGAREVRRHHAEAAAEGHRAARHRHRRRSTRSTRRPPRFAPGA